MKFSYFEFTPTFIRPIIPIAIKSDKKFMLYSALIDSGADRCIFSLDIAYALDIKLEQKNKIEFIGVRGEAIEGFLRKITIRIGLETYDTEVIFADISDFGHGILGQKGFFDHFDVKLSFHKKSIEVEALSWWKN